MLLGSPQILWEYKKNSLQNWEDFSSPLTYFAIFSGWSAISIVYFLENLRDLSERDFLGPPTSSVIHDFEYIKSPCCISESFPSQFFSYLSNL